MVGITLTAEQIRSAPPQVRRWLEQEIATSLGLAPAEPAAEPEPHLVGCSVEEAEAVFSLIQGLLPVVNVFFELGRDTGRTLPNGMHVFGLLDIQSHTQLGSPEQVLNCLEMINRALRQVGGDPQATLYGLDDRANCFVAEMTHQSVRQLWQRLIAGRGAGEPERAEAAQRPLRAEGMPGGMNAAAQGRMAGQGGRPGLGAPDGAERP